MIKEVNNKIVEDVLASFEMDYINVPNLIVEKVKEKLNDQNQNKKRFIFKSNFLSLIKATQN